MARMFRVRFLRRDWSNLEILWCHARRLHVDTAAATGQPKDSGGAGGEEAVWAPGVTRHALWCNPLP